MTLQVTGKPAVLPAGDPAVLATGDVVVVTGGGRGVTAESLFPLVRASRPKLILLGRTAAGKGAGLAASLAGKADVKKAIRSAWRRQRREGRRGIQTHPCGRERAT